MNVYVIDDEQKMLSVLERQFKKTAFSFFGSSSYDEAFSDIVGGEYDAIVCDYDLSTKEKGKNGITLIKALRDEGVTAPVLLLTGKSLEEISPWEALDSGCDDFLKKPYDPKELFARIYAMIRKTSRCEKATGNTLQFLEINVDLAQRRVLIHNKERRLGKILYYLLLKFIQHHDRLLSYELLIEELWGEDALYMKQSSNSLRVHICNLKNILGTEYAQHIQNVYGYGYIFHSQKVKDSIIKK
ncbi:hypothetical protein COB57_00150 [Candidatus Peregrinibacteria bacterium]|nr:MAG: hypothetical protein COB57_00150 [Candidatus Peregrinibacteria bacterium]